jgi:hypothetical protein
MVNFTPERRKTLYERFIPESMVDAEPIRWRTPGPFLPVAMARTPQIDEPNLAESLKRWAQ